MADESTALPAAGRPRGRSLGDRRRRLIRAGLSRRTSPARPHISRRGGGHHGRSRERRALALPLTRRRFAHQGGGRMRTRKIALACRCSRIARSELEATTRERHQTARAAARRSPRPRTERHRHASATGHSGTTAADTGERLRHATRHRRRARRRGLRLRRARIDGLHGRGRLGHGELDRTRARAARRRRRLRARPSDASDYDARSSAGRARPAGSSRGPSGGLDVGDERATSARWHDARLEMGSTPKGHPSDDIVTGTVQKVSKKSIDIESRTGERRRHSAHRPRDARHGRRAGRQGLADIKEGQEVRASFNERRGEADAR